MRYPAWNRTVGWGIVTLFLLLIFLALPSCASTDRGQYAQMNDTFIASVQVLVVAKQTGVFTDQEWNDEIKPAINLANSLLDYYNEASKTGDSSVSRSYFDRFQEVMALLRPFIVKASEARR